MPGVLGSHGVPDCSCGALLFFLACGFVLLDTHANLVYSSIGVQKTVLNDTIRTPISVAKRSTLTALYILYTRKLNLHLDHIQPSHKTYNTLPAVPA